MIHLTPAEKADRYDALQVAIAHYIKIYRKEMADDNRKAADLQNMFAAYHKGRADVLCQVAEVMELWVN